MCKIRTAADPLELYRDADTLALGAYAWPGGYPMIYVSADGGVLCPDCANGRNGSEATTDPDAPANWRLTAGCVHWEGPAEVCDHCGADIESAYGELDE